MTKKKQEEQEQEPDEFFTIKNSERGEKIVVNSTQAFKDFQKRIDVISEEMYVKAEKEEDPKRKRFMLMYAKNVWVKLKKNIRVITKWICRKYILKSILES